MYTIYYMLSFIRFFFVSVIIYIAATIISVGWPKLTGSKRPDTLQTTYNLVKNTTLAKNTASVLGVSDEKKTSPIDYRQLILRSLGSAAGAVEQKMTQAVSDRIFSQIVGNIEKLSPQQQKILKDKICRPDSKKPE